MDILDHIREFADKAHGDQTRKYSSDRYIVHPVRVMEKCKAFGATLPMQAAALLHDVLEDTPVSEKELHQFLLTLMNEQEAKETIDMVVELTDVFTKEQYPRWNRRKRKQKESQRIQQTSGASQTIKYADIIDNCREIVKEDPEFAGTFLCECRMILQKMPNGHPQLYQEAINLVNDCLLQVPKEYRTAY